MKRYLPIIVLLLTMSGCQEVQTSDVVGTWAIKEQSREWMPLEVKEALGKITVSADGTFVAYELPKKGYFDSGKYTDRWKVISVNTVRIRKTGTSRIPGQAQACIPTSSNQKNATILQNFRVKSSFLVVSGGFERFSSRKS